ncbi:MAG: FIST C-terminal domain-containing protein [Lachnospiraceae bacterium]|nr:FIST C-terminal domain-containing protein [Lachnospiraceae bacterium]
MKSKVLYTPEMDDLELAVEELMTQAEEFEFKKNSIALVYGEDVEDFEYDELIERLREKWDFDILGCTAMSMITNVAGYVPDGISILLLSADDCQFATGITNTLTKDNYAEEIERVYRETEKKLDGEVKMIISYGIMVKSIDDVSGDGYVEVLNKLSNNAPIFGGLASDNFNFSSNRVFCNDSCVADALNMVLITGNIKPKFVSRNSVSNRALFSYVITESKANHVFKLGNDTLLNVMNKEQIGNEKEDVVADYLLSPFLLSIPMGDSDVIETARNISSLNHMDGSGVFLGGMPEGSTLGIGIINKDDVKNSVEKACAAINDMLDDPDYEYSTLLCTTCAARFLALASDVEAEGQMCLDNLPKNLELMGIYAFGEFCPVKGLNSDKYYNSFHNFTFTIVAF